MKRPLFVCIIIITLAGLACVLILANHWLPFPSNGNTSLPRVEKEVRRPEVVWTFEPPERGAIVSSPLVAGERIFVPTIRDAGLATYGAVYCLERSTGRPIWIFDNDGKMLHMYSSPCLADGRLYVGEGMHQNFACKFYCLDAATGKELWHFETGGHIESTPCVADGRVSTVHQRHRALGDRPPKARLWTSES